MIYRTEEPPHFHIHWIGKQERDWECFDSYDEAVGRALEITRPHEGFQIEEVAARCPLRSG